MRDERKFDDPIVAIERPVGAGFAHFESEPGCGIVLKLTVSG